MDSQTPPEWVAIVLAAGQGTRMKSALPKVLHPVAGKPMVSWVVDAALEAGVGRAVVVVGHGRESVEAELAGRFGDKVETALQAEQRGTGHAVQCAMASPSLVDFAGRVLVLNGDCPLLPSESLRALMDGLDDAPMGLLTCALEDPTGYGRILRDREGAVSAIREHRDATAEERQVREVNPGLYAMDAAFARQAIAGLRDDNAQGELYITDLVAVAATEAHVVGVPWESRDLRGVNDRAELAACAASRRRAINEALARSGVGIVDLDATYIDADCEVAPDAWIAPGVHLRGHTKVAAGARIDTGSVLTDVEVLPGAEVYPHTVAERSVIGPQAKVGPFSHLRAKTLLSEGAKVGNFSETKNTKVGKGSKVNHLSYVGDGVIGEGVNIGAGTIFCNYDGVQKHTTTLEDGVFIGSDSQLVAPITVGKGAYVASGTTVTRNVPADALAVSRTKQQNKEGYASRLRATIEAKKKRREAKS